MSGRRGGNQRGGRGRSGGGGRGASTSADPPAPSPFSGSRGRGGGGGGGGRGAATSADPPLLSGGGGGRGRSGGGGGRGRGASSAVPQPAPSSSSGGGGRGASSADPPAPSASASPSPSSSSLSLVRDVEQKLSLQEPPPASTKAKRFPARPGFGTLGVKCWIRANHFLVDLEDKDLHHYDVSISPEVTSKVVNRAVIRQLVDTYRESHLGRRKPVYDGSKSMHTAGPLPFTSKEFLLTLVDNDERTVAPRKERVFKVSIKLVAQADLHHLRQFLIGRQTDAPQETLQVLDVVLRESPSHNYAPVSRSFFSPQLGPRSPIGDGMECWRGFYQSIRPTQMGLSLNVDISATSFYEPIPVIEFVAKFLNKDPSRPLSDPDRIKVKKALKGIKVQVIHRGEFCRRYRISGITSQPTNQLTFPVDDQGTTMSVVQYFRDKYGYPLQHVIWPSLQAGSDNRPTYLPMEVCKIVEGQRYSKKLNERQVTAILRETCKRPQERERNILEMVKHNNYNGDEFAKEFGIQVRDKLATFEARVLPPPMLKYHDTGREARCQPRVGQWNMINKKMVNGGTVEYWTCLNFSRVNQAGISQFCWDLVSMCGNIGMNFSSDPLVPFRSVRADNIERTLKELHNQCTAQLVKMGVEGKQLQLLIVILPEISGSYGRIKRICETELGIVSQCCLPKHVSRNNKQYLENVALKINVKAGGRNTVLADALAKRIPLVTDAPTIIFGADVTHPQPGEDSSPSIAAVVASMDWPEVTKYRGLVSAQRHRQEIIEDLFKTVQDPQRGPINGGMIRELLIAFWRSTRRKPHRIIFYRDGVSEGQFSQVLLYELDAIQKACASLEEGYLPPVTFVVVQKRHHTRLFAADHRDRNSTDRSGNILPGTVVDTNICHPTEFDFYLCSHAGIQGTSRPTHYHVLWDDNKFSADGLQMLTNNLCYTYARCTRSVSIVPPAYYAHLAAFRARYYIDGDSSDGGSVRGGSNTREGNIEVRVLPQIKENVKDVMFYC